MTQYKTLKEVKKKYNTTYVVQVGNLLQVQDANKVFHYLVENCTGWNDLGITSGTGNPTDINPEFFSKISEGE